MKLEIKDFMVAESIDVNFEELKNEVAVKMQDYTSLTYTEEQIPTAKKDLATMRKFVKALDEARKNVKTKLLEPYTEFERKIKEIESLVNQPIALIDKQVKDYEDSKKIEKAKEIADYYNSLDDKPDFNIIDVIYNPKWQNATYSMATIKKEIDDVVTTYNNGILALKGMTEFQFEMIEEFKRTLDLGRALNKQLELKEQAKRKRAVIEQDTTPRKWVGFEVFITPSEGKLLKEFLEVNEIKIREITKEN